MKKAPEKKDKIFSSSWYQKGDPLRDLKSLQKVRLSNTASEPVNEVVYATVFPLLDLTHYSVYSTETGKSKNSFSITDSEKKIEKKLESSGGRMVCQFYEKASPEVDIFSKVNKKMARTNILNITNNVIRIATPDFTSSTTKIPVSLHLDYPSINQADINISFEVIDLKGITIISKSLKLNDTLYLDLETGIYLIRSGYWKSEG